MAVLVGVSGGVGALVALLVTPQFRALNRISVFVAFFSIAAVVAALDRGVGRLGKWRAPVTYGVATALVLFAFIDQRPDGRPGVSALAATFDSDRAFVERIERLLPPGAMVYQLPYTQFPEVPALHREPLYSSMRMFAHSRHLRWSYGGMKGRPGDGWHQALNRLPLRDRLGTIGAAGFTGLVLDRAALPDRGLAHDQALAAFGAIDRFESRDGSLAFYRLHGIGSRANGSRPPLWVAGRGFYREEGDLPDQWNWSEGDAEMHIHQRRRNRPGGDVLLYAVAHAPPGAHPTARRVQWWGDHRGGRPHRPGGTAVQPASRLEHGLFRDRWPPVYPEAPPGVATARLHGGGAAAA